jgi:hypothetical protein
VDLVASRCTKERTVDVATAHALITLDALIYAARWATSLPELADELHVTQDVAHVRLNHLHPAERAAMRRALQVDRVEDAG